MRKFYGYTIMELVIFIVVMGIIGTSILSSFIAVLRYTPKVHQETVATQSATRCIEWFLGKRYLYGFNSITCPSTTVPSFCTVPSGYTISTNVDWTTLYGDSSPHYKTVTVTVSGVTDATLSLLLADY